MAERIVEFEGRRIAVPADATDAEVAQIIGSSGTSPTGEVAPAPAAIPTPPPALTAPPPERSMIDTIMGVTTQGLRGARQGMANLFGLPVDAVNNAPRLLNLLPGVDGIGRISPNPVGGSEWLDKTVLGMGGLVPEPPAPRGMAETAARRIGEELGASAVPAGGALVAGAKVGVQGARKLPGLARMFVEPAAVAPARYGVKEMGIASGAGGGAAIANMAVDRNTPTGQLADFGGAITGAGLTGLAGMIARGGKTTFDALRQNPAYSDAVVRDAVTDRILEAGGYRGANGAPADATELIDIIMNPRRTTPSELIPGYKETVADRTGNPGIAALEYGRQQGPGAGRFVEQRSANSEAVDAALGKIAPTETPGTFRDALVAARDDRFREALLARQAAEDEAARAVQPLAPQSTPEQRGSVIRTELETARDAARQKTEDAYAAANVAGKPVDPAPLAQSLDQAVAGLTAVERGLIPQSTIDRVAALGRPQEAAPVATGILDPSGAPIMRDPAAPAPVVLKEATDLKSELQRLQRAAIADPGAEKGGRNAARVLGQMIDTVDGYIAKNLTPDEAAKLEAARGTKFEEAEAFGRQGDPVADVLARRDGGVPRVRDDQVAGRFVQPQAMDRLFQEADTPATRAAIRDEVLAKGDTSSAERIDRFLQDFTQQVDRFPGLRDELTAASRARAAEAQARGAETTMQRDLGTDTQPGRGPIGKYLQYSDANSERAISEVLASKDPAAAADELISAVKGSPKALEGARAAFWQKLRTEATSKDNAQRSMGGKDQWRGDWMKRWLDDPRTSAVAEKLYADKPADLEALRAFANVLDNTDLRTRGKAMGSPGTSQGLSNIMTPETLQSRGYAYMRGQISGTYLATSIAAVIARRAVRSARADAIERMTDEVLLDPAKAVVLLQENNPANRAALAKKAKAWFGNEASTIINLANEDEDQETRNTIMEERTKRQEPAAKIREAANGR